jgi:Kef-type K+ transport system membrane component KefB
MPMLIDISFLALFASFGGRLAKAINIAPMAGKIIMGIIAGPALLGVLDPYAEGVEFARLAGVLFILFEAGLHFDMNLLKKNIGIATLIAVVGVLVPLVTFTALGYYVIHLPLMASIFLGGIFTATSVGLSVEALKRAGKLETSLGNQIVGAAVIDDILGVIILTVLAKVSSAGSTHGIEEAAMNPYLALAIGVVVFLVGTYVLWQMGVADKIVKYLNKHYSENSTGIFTRFFFGMLMLGASIAAVLGLEPVLGAFGIGVVLSKVDNEIKHSAWEKIEGYMHIFVGGFLVSIGTMLPRAALVDWKVWLWAILFTVVGFYGKYIVKYLFKNKENGKLVGYAMSIRGEVGLVFVAVALANHALDETMASAALLAVILVTVLGAILFEKAVTKQVVSEK